MKECPFTTTEINKIIVWFCIPSEIQEDILLKTNTVYDRGTKLLFICFQFFKYLITKCDMEIEEDTIYDMYFLLIKAIATKTPANKLQDFTLGATKILLEELLTKVQVKK